MKEATWIRSRRDLLKSGAAAGVLGGGALLSLHTHAQGKTAMKMQLGWIAGGNQIGEVVARQLGFYAAEGIDFSITAGGPNIDGVAVVAAGRQDLGQISSSPSLMMAASQGIPVKCFAVGAQRHPYCYFSLARNPVRTPADFVGKKVGVQSTGIVLLRALLAKNKIAEKEVTIIPIGADMGPLLTGRVDVVTGWLTNTTALSVLGKDRVDLSLWDAGVRLYALPYYATVETLEKRPKELAAFLRATAKGWAHVRSHPDASVDMLVKEYPNLKRDDERAALDVQLSYSFGELTRAQGWGAMSPSVWQEQIDTYAQLGQFTAKVPKLEDVVTMDVLQATAADRIKA